MRAVFCFFGLQQRKQYPGHFVYLPLCTDWQSAEPWPWPEVTEAEKRSYLWAEENLQPHRNVNTCLFLQKHTPGAQTNLVFITLLLCVLPWHCCQSDVWRTLEADQSKTAAPWRQRLQRHKNKFRNYKSLNFLYIKTEDQIRINLRVSSQSGQHPVKTKPAVFRWPPSATSSRVNISVHLTGIFNAHRAINITCKEKTHGISSPKYLQLNHNLTRC